LHIIIYFKKKPPINAQRFKIITFFTYYMPIKKFGISLNKKTGRYIIMGFVFHFRHAFTLLYLLTRLFCDKRKKI